MSVQTGIKRGRKRCVAANCDTKLETCRFDTLSLYLFPKKEELRQKWIDFVLEKRPNWPGPTDWCALCSRHFAHNAVSFRQQFELKNMGRYSQRIRLKEDAVPTIQVEPGTQKIEKCSKLQTKEKRKLQYIYSPNTPASVTNINEWSSEQHETVPKINNVPLNNGCTVPTTFMALQPVAVPLIQADPISLQTSQTSNNSLPLVLLKPVQSIKPSSHQPPIIVAPNDTAPSLSSRINPVTKMKQQTLHLPNTGPAIRVMPAIIEITKNNSSFISRIADQSSIIPTAKEMTESSFDKEIKKVITIGADVNKQQEDSIPDNDLNTPNLVITQSCSLNDLSLTNEKSLLKEDHTVINSLRDVYNLEKSETSHLQYGKLIAVTALEREISVGMGAQGQTTRGENFNELLSKDFHDDLLIKKDMQVNNVTTACTYDESGDLTSRETISAISGTSRETISETSRETTETSRETTETLRETISGTSGTSGETISETSKETTSETSRETISRTSGETISGTSGETSETSKKTISCPSGETISETSGETISETSRETTSETSRQTISDPSRQKLSETSGETISETAEMITDHAYSRKASKDRSDQSKPLNGLMRNFKWIEYPPRDMITETIPESDHSYSRKGSDENPVSDNVQTIGLERNRLNPPFYIKNKKLIFEDNVDMDLMDTDDEEYYSSDSRSSDQPELKSESDQAKTMTGLSEKLPVQTVTHTGLNEDLPVQTASDTGFSEKMPDYVAYNIGLNVMLLDDNTIDTGLSENVPVQTTTTTGLSENLPFQTATNTGLSENLPVQTATNTGLSENLPVQTATNTGLSENLPVQTTTTTGLSENLPFQTATNTGLSENLPVQTATNTGLSENLPVQTATNTGLSENLPGQTATNTGLSENLPEQAPNKTEIHENNKAHEGLSENDDSRAVWRTDHIPIPLKCTFNLNTQWRNINEKVIIDRLSKINSTIEQIKQQKANSISTNGTLRNIDEGKPMTYDKVETDKKGIQHVQSKTVQESYLGNIDVHVGIDLPNCKNNVCCRENESRKKDFKNESRNKIESDKIMSQCRNTRKRQLQDDVHQVTCKKSKSTVGSLSRSLQIGKDVYFLKGNGLLQKGPTSQAEDKKADQAVVNELRKKIESKNLGKKPLKGQLILNERTGYFNFLTEYDQIFEIRETPKVPSSTATKSKRDATDTNTVANDKENFAKQFKNGADSNALRTEEISVLFNDRLEKSDNDSSKDCEKKHERSKKLLQTLRTTINELEDLGTDIAAWVVIPPNDKCKLIYHMGTEQGRAFMKTRRTIDTEFHVFLQKNEVRKEAAKVKEMERKSPSNHLENFVKNDVSGLQPRKIMVRNTPFQVVPNATMLKLSTNDIQFTKNQNGGFVLKIDASKTDDLQTIIENKKSNLDTQDDIHNEENVNKGDNIEHLENTNVTIANVNMANNSEHLENIGMTTENNVNNAEGNSVNTSNRNKADFNTTVDNAVNKIDNSDGTEDNSMDKTNVNTLDHCNSCGDKTVNTENVNMLDYCKNCGFSAMSTENVNRLKPCNIYDHNAMNTDNVNRLDPGNSCGHNAVNMEDVKMDITEQQLNIDQFIDIYNNKNCTSQGDNVTKGDNSVNRDVNTFDNYFKIENITDDIDNNFYVTINCSNKEDKFSVKIEDTIETVENINMNSIESSDCSNADVNKTTNNVNTIYHDVNKTSNNVNTIYHNVKIENDSEASEGTMVNWNISSNFSDANVAMGMEINNSGETTHCLSQSIDDIAMMYGPYSVEEIAKSEPMCDDISENMDSEMVIESQNYKVNNNILSESALDSPSREHFRMASCSKIDQPACVKSEPLDPHLFRDFSLNIPGNLFDTVTQEGLKITQMPMGSFTSAPTEDLSKIKKETTPNNIDTDAISEICVETTSELSQIKIESLDGCIDFDSHIKENSDSLIQGDFDSLIQESYDSLIQVNFDSSIQGNFDSLNQPDSNSGHKCNKAKEKLKSLISSRFNCDQTSCPISVTPANHSNDQSSSFADGYKIGVSNDLKVVNPTKHLDEFGICDKGKERSKMKYMVYLQNNQDLNSMRNKIAAKNDELLTTLKKSGNYESLWYYNSNIYGITKDGLQVKFDAHAQPDTSNCKIVL